MKTIKNIFLVSMVLFLASCEKEIDVEIPLTTEKLVVEGAIEQNQPPFVLLTRSSDYFAPTDINTLKNIFVHDAIVTVSNGTNSVQLQELCTENLPDSLLDEISVLIGISVIDIKTFGFCLYTTLNTSIFGEVGKTYTLSIQAEGHDLSASTTIPAPIAMNYYYYEDQPGFSNYGYLWFNQTDPPEYGNAYRIFTQRKGKDGRFLPADGSVWDDKLLNGLTFNAFIFRGHEPNSTAVEDNNETSEYFLQGDTVFVKFCTIDLPHFEFWETFETAAFNNANPFAAPTTVKTNIQGGGLGVWGGYGASFDTIVLQD
ncbi:MAG: DUF4249 family protein [Flavobacteriales bacterium]|nr:DUF4249 family protein [Flavobacteriales bacterium]